MQRTWKNQNNFEKEEKLGGHMLCDFKDFHM